MKFVSLLIFIAWCFGGELFFTNGLDKIGDSEEKPTDDEVEFENKCIEDLGCFSTGPPFCDPLNRTIWLTPDDNLEIRFLLFTRANPEEAYELDTTEQSIKESNFNPERRLKVLIHGFMATVMKGDITHKIKDALLKLRDFNVIIVDWGKHNKNMYEKAIANARVVAAKLAKLLKLIMKTTGLRPRFIHLIGHSLGAHISGWTGERIKRLGRITGLDPAGPNFKGRGKEVRLDTTDALLVDVICTDGNPQDNDDLGIGEPIGHITFYPNGGKRQPGCPDGTGVVEDAIGDLKGKALTACSHLRAWDYFLESIDHSKCKFSAVLCDSYESFEKGDCSPQNSKVAEMGFYARKKEMPDQSSFYLKTNAKESFCIVKSVL